MGSPPSTDGLYGFLQDQVFGNVLGFFDYPLSFHITPLDSTGTVYRCDEHFTFVSVVLKFYSRKWLHGQQSGEPRLRAERMRREYKNLRRARALGLHSVPHRVIRPLAISEEQGCVLVEDFSPGRDLDWYLREAVSSGAGDEFTHRLTDVAWFLADLHNRSQRTAPIDASVAISRLEELLDELTFWAVISLKQQQHLVEAGKRWLASEVLACGDHVLIHGDATPTQFLFPREHDLTVIDLEYMRPGDRAADLGRLAAELKHLFFWYTADRWRSEPYIQLLYQEYSKYARSIGDF